MNCISPEVLLGNNINHLLKPIQKTLLKKMLKEDDLMGIFAYLASDASLCDQNKA